MNRRALWLVWVALALAAFGCVANVDEGGESEQQPLGEVSQASTAAITRAEIIALGATAMGYSYWWGHGRWDPASKQYPGSCSGSCGACSHSATGGGPEYGADCSGFVAKAWQVPSASSPTTDSHPYSTYNFRYQKTHWDPINKTEIQQGDALVYNSDGKGHIMLFDSWAGAGKAVVYECAGCSIGCVHRTKSVGSSYIAIRRHSVDQTPQNTLPKGMLDKVSCSDGIGGWAKDQEAGDEPIEVVLSIGGPYRNSNTTKITLKADQYRSDLCKRVGCKHAFKTEIPAAFKDGKKYSVYAYAIDPATKEKKLLVGAPRSFLCGTKPTTTAGCGHGMCVEGTALSASCSPCAKAVCSKRPSCCESAWDAECVTVAGDTPGPCAGICYNGQTSCAHAECVEGDALPTSCSTCASSVCERDPFCCTKRWDWICASEAKKDAYCLCK